MRITEVKIRKTFSQGRLRALVSITLDGVFAVHDLKVIESEQRMFVAMPSREIATGAFIDIVHPIKAAFRRQLEQVVLEAYRACALEMNDASEKGKEEIKYEPF